MKVPINFLAFLCIILAQNIVWAGPVDVAGKAVTLTAEATYKSFDNIMKKLLEVKIRKNNIGFEEFMGVSPRRGEPGYIELQITKKNLGLANAEYSQLLSEVQLMADFSLKKNWISQEQYIRLLDGKLNWRGTSANPDEKAIQAIMKYQKGSANIGVLAVTGATTATGVGILNKTRAIVGDSDAKASAGAETANGAR
jgi:hypothetical protein